MATDDNQIKAMEKESIIFTGYQYGGKVSFVQFDKHMERYMRMKYVYDFLLLPVKSNPMKINTGTYYTVTGKYIPSCIIYSGEKKYSFPDRCER